MMDMDGSKLVQPHWRWHFCNYKREIISATVITRFGVMLCMFNLRTTLNSTNIYLNKVYHSVLSFINLRYIQLRAEQIIKLWLLWERKTYPKTEQKIWFWKNLDFSKEVSKVFKTIQFQVYIKRENDFINVLVHKDILPLYFVNF